ncbi:NADPH-dependent FMN reductase [Limoniibacter endophyticus]|uniref:FMN reductase n=1 Tax=Limoniibacter endophyticus TaxID=1565040 RepID=A0A8J3DGQ1_9HYPH|nr:NAD(P)H-dependent oxidoreductase [Limoniibacter endophyticus]GHC64685.1 FMN reductase [Limoniibacter endophyticus]
MTLQLNIIVASTRPGRVGPVFGKWLYDFAKQDGTFRPELVDLADFNLPMYDEPQHPRMAQYENESTKAWSKSVASGDAYIFITPEYNGGPTPALINALNLVYNEWNYKPAAFMSYGFGTAGARASHLTKPILTALKLMPIPEGIMVPNFPASINEGGEFVPNEFNTQGATDTIKELYRWSDALKGLRS